MIMGTTLIYAILVAVANLSVDLFTSSSIRAFA